MAAGRIKSASGRLWEACIGLEVHAQITCRTKLFSAASAETVAYAKPNTRVALVDAALPGTLPVLNKEAVNQAIRTSLALGCKVSPASYFERKHYFYCDLPQGYQITQQASPIATGGELHIEAPVHDNQKRRKGVKGTGGDWETATIRINRIQLEQDSGKSVHHARGGVTLVDLNRAGSALMEIVFEPDISSSSQAGEALRTLQRTLRQLGTCDGNMDEGSMRVDLNVSVRPLDGQGEDKGQRVEIKNMNSVKSLEAAAEYEIKRQIGCYERGEAVGRETRTYDAIAKETRRMRAKEGAVDYRFFPEPDLPPLHIAPDHVEQIRATLPELPQATRKRLVDDYGLTAYDAAVMVGEPGAVAFFETVAKGREPKTVANWICNDLFGLLKQQEAGSETYTLVTSPVTTARLGAMIDLIGAGRISVRTAKDVLAVMMFEDTAGSPEDIVKARDWEQMSDQGVLRELAETLVADPASERQLRQYVQGKGNMLGYFVGMAMKVTNGRANPQMIENTLKEVLDSKK